jgi:hypothetical protein
MTVYLLLREDQNDHGYIDVSVTGVYRDESAAKQRGALERARARDEGLRVEDDDDADWQVCWRVEEHRVD